MVADIAVALDTGLTREGRLAALLHDSPEYVIGDLISPFKAALGLDYKAFELRLLEAIHLRFGLPGMLPEEITASIKAADRIAASYEARLLAGFTEAEADRYFGPPAAAPAALATRLGALQAWPAETAEHRFLGRFAELSAA